LERTRHVTGGKLRIRPGIEPENGAAPGFRLRHAHQARVERWVVPRRGVSEIDRLADRREKSQPEEQEDLTD